MSVAVLATGNHVFSEDVTATNSDDDEVVEFVADDDPRAGVKWHRSTISTDQFDSDLFGDKSNWAAVQERLREALRIKVKTVNEFCELTGPERRKLELAGQGDIKRLVDAIENVRFQLCVVGDVKPVEGCLWASETDLEIGRIHSRFNSTLFGYGSLFDKTLRRVLSNEQHLKYKRWELANWRPQ